MAAEKYSNDVELKQLAPQPVVSIRETVKIAALGEAQGDRLRVVSRYLQQRGVQHAGPPFVRYHTFGDTETDVELGVPVAEPMVGEGRIVAGELPGGPVITLWHLGAHDETLREAYARLQAWQNEHARQPSGTGWEVYFWIDVRQYRDSATWPDLSDWRTQLVQPLAEP